MFGVVTFNIWFAIGCKFEPTEIWQIPLCDSMWQGTSRSCVMRLVSLTTRLVRCNCNYGIYNAPLMGQLGSVVDTSTCPWHVEIAATWRHDDARSDHRAGISTIQTPAGLQCNLVCVRALSCAPANTTCTGPVDMHLLRLIREEVPHSAKSTTDHPEPSSQDFFNLTLAHLTLNV